MIAFLQSCPRFYYVCRLNLIDCSLHQELPAAVFFSQDVDFFGLFGFLHGFIFWIKLSIFDYHSGSFAFINFYINKLYSLFNQSSVFFNVVNRLLLELCDLLRRIERFIY